MDIHMNGGQGDTSYAKNSMAQRGVLCKTEPILREAIRLFYSTTNPSKTIKIVDMGCSSGPNTFLAMRMIIDAILDSCSQLDCMMPDFQIFLNDLPANDFNTLFKFIPSFLQKLKAEKEDYSGSCFIYGFPRSFYGRISSTESLHIVYSTNSLHWLTQVPPELNGKLSGTNIGNIALGRTSPSCVFKVYLEQFQKDFLGFIKLRAQEIVPRGCMVLSLLGRRTVDPFDEESYDFWEPLACALRDMVAEGIVEEKKLDAFNMPYYGPHITELKNVIEEDDSFDIVQLEEVDLESTFVAEKNTDMHYQKVLAKSTRAATEPMFSSYFGPSMIDELFERFEEKLLRGTKSVSLIVSLTRKD